MPKTMSVSRTKYEKHYLDIVKQYPESVYMYHENSVTEGFEYFESDEYRSKYSEHKSILMDKIMTTGIRNFPSMAKIFIKNMPIIMSGRKKCFTDCKEYLENLETTGRPSTSPNSLIASYPNKEIWNELKKYAWENWKVLIGFTELPNQLIFDGKAVLFKYTLVCIQEMEKNKIDKAPELEAGSEVLRVYGSLGLAVNDIARWLRKEHGICCQSNHPLGGLVDTSPLAGKAGLGGQGRNGLLITPVYGQRQRIAPIFIENKLFEYTDNDDHKWIPEFCKTCKRCEKSCPVKAIYSEKQLSIQNIPGINQTRTCINRIKCFPQFNKTLGCSVCVKVCPFSKGNGSYQRIKRAITKKNNN